MKRFLRDPHTILWLGVIVLLLIATVFGLFTDIIVDVMIISGLFVTFYFIDPLIFDVRGNSVVTLFSGHLYTKRWQAFPVFLLELFIFSWASNNIIEPLARGVLNDNIISPVPVFIWFAFIFGFYWFKASRKD